MQLPEGLDDALSLSCCLFGAISRCRLLPSLLLLWVRGGFSGAAPVAARSCPPGPAGRSDREGRRLAELLQQKIDAQAGQIRQLLDDKAALIKIANQRGVAIDSMTGNVGVPRGGGSGRGSGGDVGGDRWAEQVLATSSPVRPTKGGGRWRSGPRRSAWRSGWRARRSTGSSTCSS